MKTVRHGLSIGLERTGDRFFLTLKAVGKLTHDDYQTITPMIDAALEGVPSPAIHCLIDGTEMEGWEPRAAWDDFRLGLKHGRAFERVAIYGNKHWQEIAAKVGAWLVSGEVRYFENCEEALDWLNSAA